MSKSSTIIVWWRDAPQSTELIKKDWLSQTCRRLVKFNKTLFFSRVWEREEGQCSLISFCVLWVPLLYLRFNCIICLFLDISERSDDNMMRVSRGVVYWWSHIGGGRVFVSSIIQVNRGWNSYEMPPYCSGGFPRAASFRPDWKWQRAPCAFHLNIDSCFLTLSHVCVHTSARAGWGWLVAVAFWGEFEWWWWEEPHGAF